VDYERPRPRLKRLEGLDSILKDKTEAATMAMLIVTEGHSRYYHSHPERDYVIDRWEPVIRIHMADEAIVRWAAAAMGGVHVNFDKSVGAWTTEARGIRAITVFMRVRSYIIGEKTAMIDCILKNGSYVVSRTRPCMDCESERLRDLRIADFRHRGLIG